jgi:hypothetical protein
MIKSPVLSIFLHYAKLESLSNSNSNLSTTLAAKNPHPQSLPPTPRSPQNWEIRTHQHTWSSRNSICHLTYLLSGCNFFQRRGNMQNPRRNKSTEFHHKPIHPSNTHPPTITSINKKNAQIPKSAQIRLQWNLCR